jgi:hypothetical protein
MARKKRAAKRRVTRKGKASKKKRTIGRPAEITIRRSSGRMEKFDLDRMTKTSSRSGIPFLMARDIAKGVSNRIKLEAKGKRKKTITAGRVRKMIAKELGNRKRQAIASSYGGGKIPVINSQDMAPKVASYEPRIATADTDQHDAYRANKNRVLHDRSKRLASSA